MVAQETGYDLSAMVAAEPILMYCILFYYIPLYSIYLTTRGGGTQWHSRLRHCTTSRKVASLIPDGVIGIFH